MDTPKITVHGTEIRIDGQAVAKVFGHRNSPNRYFGASGGYGVMSLDGTVIAERDSFAYFKDAVIWSKGHLPFG
jgi:hypothetical protein